VIITILRRGLPYWLREVPDIVFRTNNEPFKVRCPCISETCRRSSFAKFGRMMRV
jgi:hypothetical protein